MAHKYSTFIRKNTPEIRKRLEELGYSFLFKYANVNSIKTYPDCGRYAIVDLNYDSGCIDCGEYEELLFAIAAIRDNSDYMQWFKSEISGYYMCMDEENTGELYGSINVENHKCTPDELIEYFNNK